MTSRWLRLTVRLLAALFFVIGGLFLPFAVWADNGPNPVLGWVAYLASVLAPWVIAVWLIRLSARKDE